MLRARQSYKQMEKENRSLISWIVVFHHRKNQALCNLLVWVKFDQKDFSQLSTTLSTLTNVLIRFAVRELFNEKTL